MGGISQQEQRDDTWEIDSGSSPSQGETHSSSVAPSPQNKKDVNKIERIQGAAKMVPSLTNSMNKEGLQKLGLPHPWRRRKVG